MNICVYVCVLYVWFGKRECPNGIDGLVWRGDGGRDGEGFSEGRSGGVRRNFSLFCWRRA